MAKGQPNGLDLEGVRFSYLTATNIFQKERDESGHLRARRLCYCDCGKKIWVLTTNLRNGHAKSCGCKRLINKTRKPEVAKSLYLESYKRRAKDRGYNWELTDEEFFSLTSMDCYYCGSPPSQASHSNYIDIYKFSGVDRKDNTIGYTVNNCLPCCKTCNLAKRDMTYEDFKSWIDKLVLHQSTITMPAT